MTACIVGWSHTPFGKHDAETVESLIVRVTNEALAHAVGGAERLGLMAQLHTGVEDLGGGADQHGVVGKQHRRGARKALSGGENRLPCGQGVIKKARASGAELYPSDSRVHV